MAEIFQMGSLPDGEPRIDVIIATHNGRVETHSHDYYEIVYVADGFTLHAANGTVNILVSGDFFFVRPGEEHSYINAYENKVYNLIFHPEELVGILDRLSVLPGLSEMFSSDRTPRQGIRLLHVPMTERRAIESAIRELYDERRERRTGWECAMRVGLSSLLLRYARMYEEQWDSHPTSADDYYGYVYKVLCYIDSHYGGSITMADLSSVTGLSPDYMTRKFKSALHMTPSEYVRKFRIAKAMELLCTSSLSISDIAEATGFSDVSLFSRVFKQTVGLPPASYRKNAQPD